MRITLLGTGADHCIPAFRCICPVCKEARKKQGKHIRRNSSAVIESGDGKVMLIDMPPQILTMLSENRINDEKIGSILITHRHEDHTLGLRYLFQASEKKKFSVEKTVTLFITTSTLKSISRKILSEKNEDILSDRPGYYKIHEIKDDVPIVSDYWNIHAVETGHLSAKPSGKNTDESLGYVIEDRKGEIAVYFLDAAVNIPEKTLSFLESLHIDCLIGDCTYAETLESSGHMDIRALIKLKETLKPVRTIASHISHMNLKYEELKYRLNEHGIEIGYDGMKLEI